MSKEVREAPNPEEPEPPTSEAEEYYKAIIHCQYCYKSISTEPGSTFIIAINGNYYHEMCHEKGTFKIEVI